MVGESSAGKHIGVLVAGFVASMVTVFACGVWELPPGLRCDPAGSEPRCGGDEVNVYMCCSDDPAALELANLDGPELPDYGDRGGAGTPLFSGPRNGASRSGMCVKQGSVPPQGALHEPLGCPVPCNPSWAPELLTAVCGAASICCQTVELEEQDCVLDSDLGDGCWRPIRGSDIVGLGGVDGTSWSAASHATHQDPGGLGCEAFVEGLTTDELEWLGVERAQVLDACRRRLTVADQRGFCLGGAGVNTCPLAQPSYRDPCEQRNDDEGRTDCA